MNTNLRFIFILLNKCSVEMIIEKSFVERNILKLRQMPL